MPRRRCCGCTISSRYTMLRFSARGSRYDAAPTTRSPSQASSASSANVGHGCSNRAMCSCRLGVGKSGRSWRVTATISSLPPAHRHGVGRIELPDGHARVVRRGVRDQQWNYLTTTTPRIQPR